MSVTTHLANNVDLSFSLYRNRDRRFELRALFAVLVLTNLGLIFGNIPASNLVYHPASVTLGEWWRIFSWPFVHVSRYHLLLDGAAFLLLYHCIETARLGQRLTYLFATIAGSLWLPLLICPEIYQIGLCGLSGPAHGLMAICAMEMCQTTRNKAIGALLLLGLFVKVCWELLTGVAFLNQLHLGDIGIPIVSTHAGGVIAGVVSFIALQKSKTLFRKIIDHQANK